MQKICVFGRYDTSALIDERKNDEIKDQAAAVLAKWEIVRTKRSTSDEQNSTKLVQQL